MRLDTRYSETRYQANTILTQEDPCSEIGVWWIYAIKEFFSCGIFFVAVASDKTVLMINITTAIKNSYKNSVWQIHQTRGPWGSRD